MLGGMRKYKKERPYGVVLFVGALGRARTGNLPRDRRVL